MSNSHIFHVDQEFDCEKLAYRLSDFLRNSKGLIVQNFGTRSGGYCIQAKEGSGFKSILGMDKAIQIEMHLHDGSLSVMLGSGEWVKKGIGTWIRAIIWAPLLITSLVGVLEQSALPDEVFSYISNYIDTGGQNYF